MNAPAAFAAPRAKRRKEVVKKGPALRSDGECCEHGTGGGVAEAAEGAAPVVVAGTDAATSEVRPSEAATTAVAESRLHESEPASPRSAPTVDAPTVGDAVPNEFRQGPNGEGGEAREAAAESAMESEPRILRSPDPIDREEPSVKAPMLAASTGSPPPALETGSQPIRPTTMDAARPRREHRRRLAWAELMRRTMDLDVLECPRCGERMKVIACIDRPDVVERILRAVGLWEEPPPLAPSRAGPDDGPEWDHLG